MLHLRRTGGIASLGLRRATSAIRLLAAAMVLLLASPAARATSLRPLNIEELTAKADRIVAGRVLSVDLTRPPGRNHAVARVTVEVDEVLKGQPGGRLVFRMVASGDGGAGTISGLPRFRPGEDLVLFLYPDSRSGLTSPVGFGQGKFRRFTGKAGGKIAVNGFGNRGLFLGLSKAAEEKLRSRGHGRLLGPRGGRAREGARQLGAGELSRVVEALR